MRNISLIAAVDKQFGLGKDNQLLCHLPADLQYFKQSTLGKPIIMGRKTYASIGRPLPKRQNIVLSKQLGQSDGIEIAATLEEALQLAGTAPEIMIIGGASIYEQALPFANTLYLTHIEHAFNADVFFPSIDWSQWTRVRQDFRPRDEANCHDLIFCQYNRTP